jgi:hypothetical protein
MNRDSFTKALMATAKIACCASLLNVSCRSKTDINTPKDTGSSANDTAVVNPDSAVDPDSADTNTETGDTNVDSGDTNVDSGDTNNSQTEFDECQTLIQTEFEDINTFPDPSTIPQEVKDCCSLTAAYYDELAMENGDFDWGVIQNWTERDQCCAALEWSDGSLACTPWGPPTPPSAHKMKRRIIVRQIVKPSPVLA